ncbi:MAG: hypothetical protein AAF587_26230 [Bacteroidota bacterium]
MNLKKTTLSILIAFILSNVLTTVWYMLTDEANFVPYRREATNYAALMLNHLIYVALLVYFFTDYYAKQPRLSRGFLYGAMMAAMMYIPQAIVIRSIWEVDFNAIFLWNTVAHVVIGGIIGIAVALIYQYKNPAVTA